MIYDSLGEMALGTRLRMLSEKVTKDATKLYALYGVDLKPNWFPVFFVLTQERTEKSITAIAVQIGHSHPSVVKIVRDMEKAKLIAKTKDKSDKRKQLVCLTKKGKQIAKDIQKQYLDVNSAIMNLFQQSTHNIWQGIIELEYLLNEKTLFDRVWEQKKLREFASIRIIPYTDNYQADFKLLNEAWIRQYFKMEDSDYKALDYPEDYILNKGGAILVALDNKQVVGVCALQKLENHPYHYELAKMAVSPAAQGRRIGYLLGRAILKKAKELGANHVYLESNTVLTPAINLYQKLGFKKVSGLPTPYERCNIQMVVDL